jgi:eukaryotic-like serine/threonine-protein kinase
MPLVDSLECREILRHLFPGIQIESNLSPSGQRLVYFCHFDDQEEVPSQREWLNWGKVVLKISEDVHPSVIARLEKERDVLNSLSSEHFPKLLYCDVFSEDPVTDRKFRHRLFATIEQRIPGRPLSECSADFSTEQAVVRLVIELAEGLSMLWNHPQRIIHRDLKPANILITPALQPVIIDLGIVREQGVAGITSTHADIGPCTPAYASPEQLKNEKRFITFKSDFFSLGVLIYELLSGSNPFMTSPLEPVEFVIHRALTHIPPSLDSLGVAGKELSRLVERLMEKEPYRRPRTPQALLSELRGLGGGR